MGYHAASMSLSRQYRPKRFADITGQTIAKETLRKEVAMEKIGHAYVFSGPRGVGKTTAARIFAKALNCLQPLDGEPCNICALCVETDEGRMLDCIEMDAASHTGIDNVRESIVEHVRFAPSRGKRKVYILDEVHMLSTPSWNALLKTIEEPPAYAVFIFATTELHKVPATVISRCQRFDFRRLSVQDLAERISFLAAQEQVKVADAVVRTIAAHADGSVRDAETLLGQLLSLGEREITSEIAALVMPISRLPLAAKLLTVCADRDHGRALAVIARFEEEGIPLLPIFDDLLQSIRQLLLCSADTAQTRRLKEGDEGEKQLAEIVGRYTPAELGEMALLCMERRRDAKQGMDPRFALELAATAIAIGVLPHGPGFVAQQTQTAQPVSAPIAPSVVVTKKEPVQEPVKASVTPTTSVETPKPVALASAAPTTPAASTVPMDSSSSFDLSLVQRKWATFMKAIAEKNASWTFILTTSRPIQVVGNTLTIQFQYAFHRDKLLNDVKNRRTIEDTMATVLGVPSVCCEAVIGEDASSAVKRSEDMVSNIIKAFGGNVVEEVRGSEMGESES